MRRHSSPTVAGSGGEARMAGSVAPHSTVVGQQASTHVVDVVIEAVVGRAHRDNRPERLRAPGRRLQAGGPAPRRTHHPDGALAPGLRRDPVDDGDRVVQLLRPIHVRHQALGVTGAPHVDPHAGVPVACEEGMVAFVPDTHHVPLPVWNVLEHGRCRIARRRLRQPQACRQADAAGHRYPAMLDLPDSGYLRYGHETARPPSTMRLITTVDASSGTSCVHDSAIVPS